MCSFSNQVRSLRQHYLNMLYYHSPAPHNAFSVNNGLHIERLSLKIIILQGGSNMTGTDLCVNKPHCAAAVRP